MQAIFELPNEHREHVNLSHLVYRNAYSGKVPQLHNFQMVWEKFQTLAIAFMSTIENPILERKPILYCRHTYCDCFIVCPMQSEMDMCFGKLNEPSPPAKFIRENPKETGCLSERKSASVQRVV